MHLMTVAQTANRCAISIKLVRKLIGNGDLPMVRVGRCVRLKPDDVEELIQRGYSGSNSRKQSAPKS